MNKSAQKALMWIFGIGMIAGLAVFLMLYQSSPGPLSAPHAQAIPGNFIRSCKQCHTDEGLTAGCLNCHIEIEQQLDTDKGYHAHLLRNKEPSCEQCHPEHHGNDFPLISALAWEGKNNESFTHPHVDFVLEGSHDNLKCEDCHRDKLKEPFFLAGFEDQHRTSTMLGLQQNCISCHEDIHGNGERTQNCTACHDQNAFKPAPYFNHDEYFVLEGVHANAACSACHIPNQAESMAGAFDPVKGTSCIDCHEMPHRFIVNTDCQSCHLAADESWSKGQRGVDLELHSRFGFPLDAAHGDLACEACHERELPYAERYPDPKNASYVRQPDNCTGCHEDPHDGQFQHAYSSCRACHYAERFTPTMLGPAMHSKTYPLLGAHQAVACTQCHQKDDQSGIRQFAATPTACRDCHNNPHGDQFQQEIRQNDCTACHQSNCSSFAVKIYTHQNMRPFFMGKGHVGATCNQCHAVPETKHSMIQYKTTPTDCAACHQDIHRGQFQLNGVTQCQRCHDTTDEWSALNFSHENDSSFSLEGSHMKVACVECHRPVPQKDGRSVIQYRPLTTRCEDCHGFNM